MPKNTNVGKATFHVNILSAIAQSLERGDVTDKYAAKRIQDELRELAATLHLENNNADENSGTEVSGTD